MNAKKKKEKRIYKQGLMNREERDAFNKEIHTELMNKAQKSNKKIKIDINENPVW